MRGAWLVVVLGCRLNFDESSSDATGPSDVALGDPEAGAIDAVPIDAVPIDAMPIDAVPTDAVPLVCPAGYVDLGIVGSRYLAVDSTSTWLAAEQACETDGTHLAIVDSLAEDTALTAALPGNTLWTGVTNRRSIDVWRTVTNQSPTYLMWGVGEPDLGTPQCVELDEVVHRLADQDCTSGRRYFCECDGRSGDPASY